MARLGFTPQWTNWIEKAQEEARNGQRLCTRCSPPHPPSFRLPGIYTKKDWDKLDQGKYEQLDTTPYILLVMWICDGESESWRRSTILGARVTIWVPKLTTENQHIALVMETDYRQ